jgi:hypothetical protein
MSPRAVIASAPEELHQRAGLVIGKIEDHDPGIGNPPRVRLTGEGPMIKTVPIRALGGPAAVCALLVACAPNPAPVQPIPLGPTAAELANYATAQMQYRVGLATGNGDAVAEANQTFLQIPEEIFSRQDPRLFAAALVCERYRVPGPAASGRTTPTPFEPQCQNIEWRYTDATIAIRQDLRARIAASDLATIAQGDAAHR